MKNILIFMPLLGIILNSLSAGVFYTPTPEPTDSYPLNTTLGGNPMNSFSDVKSFLFNQNSIDPAAVNFTNTHLGTIWMIQSNKVFEFTGTNPTNGPSSNEYIIVENNSTTPSTFKLEGVIGNPYQGAPLVSNVFAQQIPGTKDVQIDFSVLLAENSSGGAPGTDKPSFLEFWIKSDPSSAQWEPCSSFQAGSTGGNSGNTVNLTQPGPLNMSGGFQAIWKAGDDKPNFQTATGKIRVMVTYDHQDPNNQGTTIQGSQWDGYEAAIGPMFTNSTSNTNKIMYPNDKTIFYNWLYDPANSGITSGITRLGSFNNNGEMDPVYQFSTAQLTNLTLGGSGAPGKYALGLAVDGGGVTSYHFIPVQ